MGSMPRKGVRYQGTVAGGTQDARSLVQRHQALPRTRDTAAPAAQRNEALSHLAPGCQAHGCSWGKKV